MPDIEVRRTYKFCLYHNKRNKHLVNAIDIAGIIWNHALALSKRYYRRYRKSLSFSHLMRHIAKLRRQCSRDAYWQILGSQAVQDVIQRLEKAYKRFFNGQGGFPRFKKVKKYPSFTLKQSGWKWGGGNTIHILGRAYKFVKSREIDGKIKTVTVKRDSMGRLWLCFSAVMRVAIPEASTGKSGGFDFGLKTFLTNDEGAVVASPQFFKQSQGKIASLNRELSRKQTGSNNRQRATYRLAKAHHDIANKRRDWFFKLASQLCDDYATLYFEDLNLKGMQRMWGRKINDLAFGEFLTILQHVADKRGTRVIKIDRWEPTTQTCRACGKRHKLTLHDRTFHCDCGLEIDRDHNAALNILRVGASTHDLGVVRRESATADSRSPA